MHPTRRTRIPPKGLRSPLEGSRPPHRDTGPYKGPICRENARPLLKGHLLFEHGSGPLKQRPGYGVLRSWSDCTCNVFNCLVCNSLARAFVEINQAANRPLQEKGQHVGLGSLGFDVGDARMPRPMGGHRCRCVALWRCGGRCWGALRGALLTNL